MVSTWTVTDWVIFLTLAPIGAYIGCRLGHKFLRSQMRAREHHLEHEARRTRATQ